MKRGNDKRNNDDWARDRNDKKWDAFKWDDRKWGDNKWERNWCSVNKGCSAKELSKGQVNLCVNMKHKNTQICVSQKKADFWLNFSQIYKNKIFSTTKTFFKDVDGDSYGSNSVTVQGCGETAPKGYVNRGNDCNDNDKKINPGVADGCPVTDGKDNNCDGIVDNGRVNIYTDNDQDTYGDSSTVRLACPSATTSDRGGDCNDNNSAVNPVAIEVACDGVDNNCDGNDQQDLTAYPDIDNDSFGDSNSQGYLACSGVQNNADCNDNDPTTKPGVPEICDNNKDDNCNGEIDEECSTGLTSKCPCTQEFYQSKPELGSLADWLQVDYPGVGHEYLCRAEGVRVLFKGHVPQPGRVPYPADSIESMLFEDGTGICRISPASFSFNIDKSITAAEAAECIKETEKLIIQSGALVDTGPIETCTVQP